MPGELPIENNKNPIDVDVRDECREAGTSDRIMEDGKNVSDIGGGGGEQAGTGEAEASNTGGGGGEEDQMVDVMKVIERYKMTTGKRNNGKTQYNYAGKFCKFMDSVPGITRKQLASLKGKAALIEFLNEERASYRAGVKKVWTKGLGLPWPLIDDDTTRPPRVRPTVSPETSTVIRMHDEMMKERRDERRLAWLMTINIGWSPADVVRTDITEVKEWKGLHYIIRERQKTGSWLVAVIPDEVLSLLRKVKRFGVKPVTVLHWCHIVADKAQIPVVTPKALRKWFKCRAREAGLSKPATAAIMGHDTATVNMQDWYDQPPIEDILTEQAEKLPHGMLATVLTPKVELVADDNDAMTLWHQYKVDKITTMELVNKLEQLKSSQKISLTEIKK